MTARVRIKLYGPVFLSSICLTISLYCIFTDAVYRVSGCVLDEMAGIVFFFGGFPVSLLALSTACLAVRNVAKSRGLYWGHLIVSLVASAICVALIGYVFITAASGNCVITEA